MGNVFIENHREPPTAVIKQRMKNGLNLSAKLAVPPLFLTKQAPWTVHGCVVAEVEGVKEEEEEVERRTQKNQKKKRKAL